MWFPTNDKREGGHLRGAATEKAFKSHQLILILKSLINHLANCTLCLGTPTQTCCCIHISALQSLFESTASGRKGKTMSAMFPSSTLPGTLLCSQQHLFNVINNLLGVPLHTLEKRLDWLNIKIEICKKKLWTLEAGWHNERFSKEGAVHSLISLTLINVIASRQHGQDTVTYSNMQAISKSNCVQMFLCDMGQVQNKPNDT